jgi:Protein of unknown function (DUF2274)
MSKLKIGPIEDDKPVTMTIKLSAGVHRDLIAYAEALKRESGQKIGSDFGGDRLVGTVRTLTPFVRAATLFA